MSRALFEDLHHGRYYRVSNSTCVNWCSISVALTTQVELGFIALISRFDNWKGLGFIAGGIGAMEIGVGLTK